MRGDGSLYKRGSVWWMKFSRQGRSYCMSCETTVKEVAKAKLRTEMEKARGPQWLDPHQRRVTVGELVSDLQQWYRTHQMHDRLADVRSQWDNHLKEHFEHVRADLLTTTHLRNYREARLKEGDCNTTVNREFAVLRRAYRIAMESEPPKVLRIPKFEMTREDNARKVFIDAKLQQKLIEAAAKRGLWQRVLIEMAFTYGWRKSELVDRLHVRNVDLVDGAVRLDKTKNGEAREVPLTRTLSVLLQPLIAGRAPHERVFPVVDLRTEWAAICELAGVKSGKKGGIIMHDIRRSSARNKRAAGIDTSLIMKLQGWKTDSMFRRYALVDRSDLQAALQQETAYQLAAQAQREAEMQNFQTATVQLQSEQTVGHA